VVPPTPAPVVPPTQAPVVPPTQAPVVPPTPAPVVPPTQAPVAPPTQAPVVPPTPAPVVPPTQAPMTPAPITPAPVTPAPVSACGIPQFEGDWIKGNPQYPLKVGESQGAMFGGKEFMIVSGFWNNWSNVTKEVYKLDTTNPAASWVKQDDIISELGISHTGFTVVGQKFYVCGGYMGPNPGPSVAGCFVFDNTVAPGQGKQWTALPSLPEPRGGGSLLYIEEANSLLWAGGSVRVGWQVTDYGTAWLLDLNNVGAGWVQTTTKPFASNHLAFTKAKDALGKVRYYVMGGQLKGGEGRSELSDLVEFVYNPSGADSWIRRANMMITRGHASSSTHGYGCGFITAGGHTNGGGAVREF